MNERRLHWIFEISVLVKGALALIECAGGVALGLIKTATIVALVNWWTVEALIGDRHDFIARRLRHFAEGYSVGAQHFYALYLLSHGAVKLILMVGLLRKQLWAYPASIFVLALFVVYQLYRYSYTHAVGLIVLSGLDAAIMVMALHEYRVLRRHAPVAA